MVDLSIVFCKRLPEGIVVIIIIIMVMFMSTIITTITVLYIYIYTDICGHVRNCCIYNSCNRLHV